MRIEELEYLKQYGAEVDIDNKCFTLPLENDGSVIGFFPLECVQVYIYDVRGGELPDLIKYGLRKPPEGTVLRTLVCREGQACLTRGEKKSIVYRGEVSVGLGKMGASIVLSAKKFKGIEAVIQVEDITRDSIICRDLYREVDKMHVNNPTSKNEPLTYYEISSKTKRDIDEIFKLFATNCDNIIMLLRLGELGYDYMCDFKAERASLHYFVTPAQLLIAEDIHRTLTEDFGQKLTAADFAEKYQLSETSVKKYFKIVYGYDFKEYKSKVRMEEAKRLLCETDLTVGEISARVGYATQAKFGEIFKQLTGFTPREYRHQALVKKSQGTV